MTMTVEERANAIADKCRIGPRSRIELRRIVHAEALKMLKEIREETRLIYDPMAKADAEYAKKMRERL